jgi:hypothetical protein
MTIVIMTGTVMTIATIQIMTIRIVGGMESVLRPSCQQALDRPQPSNRAAPRPRPEGLAQLCPTIAWDICGSAEILYRANSQSRLSQRPARLICGGDRILNEPGM